MAKHLMTSSNVNAIKIPLPLPWIGKTFEINEFSPLTFLIGPNGSGKSRFVQELKNYIPSCRLLGTDRLAGTGIGVLPNITSDNMANGFSRNWFGAMKECGHNFGAGIDAFVILEEQPYVRILIEATLSELFSREIKLEWDSGMLIPRARSSRTGQQYRLDREECHGIRELLIMLTHLYDSQYESLIIDEPELNLHPQYQSFFLQEVRKTLIFKQHASSKANIFLVTHSPYIIDLRTTEDLSSIILFSSNHETPKSIKKFDDRASKRFSTLIPLLNSHSKQFFFADDPIFVEGILDAQILNAIQEKRNVSVSAAGSCIIDVGGVEEVNKFLELCAYFDKNAFFVFDLDSLFIGSLRKCIGDGEGVGEFLANLGLGSSLVNYCGELDKKLTEAVRKVFIAATIDEINELKKYLSKLDPDGKFEDNKKLAKARVAVLIAMRIHPKAIAEIISNTLTQDIEGRLGQILQTLSTKNVFVLPGGALEHYLPSFKGNIFELNDAAKRGAVEDEIAFLSKCEDNLDFESRYGEFYKVVEKLPAKSAVDSDKVLLGYLSDYTHDFQKNVCKNPDWSLLELQNYYKQSNILGKLFQVRTFNRISDTEFNATIDVLEPRKRFAKISQDTNAGMQKITLESANS